MSQNHKRNSLNKSEPHINRGFELMLRQNSRREELPEPKTFSFCFGKMISLFGREIHIDFSFNLNVKKVNL